MQGTTLLSNVTASQKVHEAYGGVVPELASRAHQQNVLPVVDQALKQAGVKKEQLSAIAFTRGPGLMGSLLVGVNFAKGFARALNIPLIDVNHLQGHVMAHFIDEPEQENPHPPFPFLCLLVSGGNSQIIKVNSYDDMEILGQTIDDAAGEAIDKCSKVMGLGYPGGPIIDRLARQGNPKAYKFSEPHIPGLDYSFSGLKTSFLYSLQKWVDLPICTVRKVCAVAAGVAAAVLLAACGGKSAEEQAMAVAQQSYEALRQGDFDEFLAARAFSAALPGGYREQLLTACRQYAHQQQSTHGGWQKVEATRARMDSTLNLMQVFLTQRYADGTAEEIVVPMVLVEGEWRMK